MPALKAAGVLVAACLIIGGDLSEGDRRASAGSPAAAAARSEAGGRPSDGTVRWLVRARYRADWAVNERRIAVRAAGGVVTLTGTVESELARARAVRIAAGVRGVTSVDDRLRVDRFRRLAE